MMTARLTPRVAVVAGIGLVLLVLVVGWFLLVAPKRSTASDLGSQIDAAQTQLTLALAEQRTLRREQRSRAVELAALTRSLPSEVEMSGILRQLTSSAAAAGVRVDTVTPTAVTPGAGYQTIPMTIVVAGRYFGIMNFVHNLRARTEITGSKVRSSGRLFRVDGMQFSGGTSSATPGQAGLLQVTITVDAFTSAPADATTLTQPGVVSSSQSGTVPSSAPAP
jgi:Tfp pilus assembly protein PilO